MNFRTVIALLGACSCLAGCAGSSRGAHQATAVVTTPVQQASGQQADDQSAITPVDDTLPVNSTVNALHALRLDDLPALKHLTASDLIAKFGEPDFTRREAASEIWQYRGKACVLDLFLYPEGTDLRVVDAITRSRVKSDDPENKCLPSGESGTQG